MRKLKALILAMTLLLSSFGASATFAQQDNNRLTPAEYNVGFCGNQFTEIHLLVGDAVIAGDAVQVLTPLYHMTNSTTIAKDEDGPSFVVTRILQNKDGSIQFQAEAKLFENGKDHVLSLTGATYKDKIAFLLSIDGSLGSVWYGKIGTKDEMISEAEGDSILCSVLHSIDPEGFPEFIAHFLHQDDSEVPVTQN